MRPDRLELTARYTGRVWSAHALPGAKSFDSWRGRAVHAAFRLLQAAFAPFAPRLIGRHDRNLVLRHNAITARAEKVRPGAIVEIGSGYSGRGISLAEKEWCNAYVDCDLDAVASTKRRLVEKITAGPAYRIETLDVTDEEWPERLDVHGADRGVLVICEGVGDYLTMEQKRRAWTNVQRFLLRSGGGRFVVDIYPRDRWKGERAVARAYVAFLSAVTRSDLAQNLFDSSVEAMALLLQCGFTSAEELDLGPDLPFALLEARMATADER